MFTYFFNKKISPLDNSPNESICMKNIDNKILLDSYVGDISNIFNKYYRIFSNSTVPDSKQSIVNMKVYAKKKQNYVYNNQLLKYMNNVKIYLLNTIKYSNYKNRERIKCDEAISNSNSNSNSNNTYLKHIPQSSKNKSIHKNADLLLNNEKQVFSIIGNENENENYNKTNSTANSILDFIGHNDQKMCAFEGESNISYYNKDYCEIQHYYTDTNLPSMESLNRAINTINTDTDSEYSFHCKNMSNNLITIINKPEFKTNFDTKIDFDVYHPMESEILYVNAPSLSGFDNSERIIPSYYFTGKKMESTLFSIEFLFTIEDDIRNMRPLNDRQIKFISKLNNEEIFSLIQMMNESMKILSTLLLFKE